MNTCWVLAQMSGVPQNFPCPPAQLPGASMAFLCTQKEQIKILLAPPNTIQMSQDGLGYLPLWYLWYSFVRLFNFCSSSSLFNSIGTGKFKEIISKSVPHP